MEKEIVTIIILLWKDTELLAPLLSTIQEDNIDIKFVGVHWYTNFVNCYEGK